MGYCSYSYRRLWPQMSYLKFDYLGSCIYFHICHNFEDSNSIHEPFTPEPLPASASFCLAPHWQNQPLVSLGLHWCHQQVWMISCSSSMRSTSRAVQSILCIDQPRSWCFSLGSFAPPSIFYSFRKWPPARWTVVGFGSFESRRSCSRGFGIGWFENTRCLDFSLDYADPS